jgi:hypothetical protein
MKKIILNTQQQSGPTIMVFVEGTILKPKSWLHLYNHNAYIPIGNAVEIIAAWQLQNANIIYCTSRKRQQADQIASLLRRYGFRGDLLVFRERKETYKAIVEAIQPDILIEDDCKSIGGAWQRCITKVKPEIKERIVSIIVPEFKGIDHLSVDIGRLRGM